MPLKQCLFFWRCLVGALPVSQLLAKRHISSDICCRCALKVENIPHLLWDCTLTRRFLLSLKHKLRARFPSFIGGKFFWIFGIMPKCMSGFVVFSLWLRYWALWTIWQMRNHSMFGQPTFDSFAYFRSSFRQSLYDCRKMDEIDDHQLEAFFHCF